MTTRSGRDAEEFSSLLRKAQQGDRAAMAALYARYSRHVTAIVRRRLPTALRDKYDTVDLVQSVFAEVLRDLPRLEDKGDRAFGRLLAMKAESKVRLKLRRHLGVGGRRAEGRLVTDDDRAAKDGDVIARLSSLDDDAKLQKLLTTLDAASRRVLTLHGEGKSFGEIAAALGLSSDDAARKRYARAVAELKRLWETKAPRRKSWSRARS